MTKLLENIQKILAEIREILTVRVFTNEKKKNQVELGLVFRWKVLGCCLLVKGKRFSTLK
jgi:hypothetical protein